MHFSIKCSELAVCSCFDSNFVNEEMNEGNECSSAAGGEESDGEFAEENLPASRLSLVCYHGY